ncbi:MAG: hypothetical protein A4E19_07555 [Nitrospira sp. SG-bin1]|nr:MAG: hypothetical protein A4E19_07555 [Nitrospira sp. SG-bin1]
MEPARKLEYPRNWDKPSVSPSSAVPKHEAPERQFDEQGEDIQPWEIKLGKMIFYLTVAAGLWFFYWFNGIQCPC